jgi:hypothetical protein
MITEKIKRNIKNELLGWTMFWWAIVMICVWMVLPSFDYTKHLMVLLLGSVIVLACLLLIAYIVSIRKCKTVTKRISNDINQEAFQCYNRYALSTNWMIYHKRNRFIPFKKENIRSLYYDGKNILVDDAETNGVYVIPCNAKMNQTLQDWYHLN